jgi:hypothetical protein
LVNAGSKIRLGAKDRKVIGAGAAFYKVKGR